MTGCTGKVIIALAATVLISAGPAAGQQPTARLTLQEVIDEALRQSPLVGSPQDAVRLAEVREEAVRAQYGVKIAPSFTGGSDPLGAQRLLGLTVSRRLPFGTEVAARATSVDYDTGGNRWRDAGYTVSLAQPLLGGFSGAAREPLVQARRQVITSERALREARQQLVVTVATAYFGIVREQRLVEAASLALERARTLRALSEARARVGLATELDVLRADVLAAQAEVALANRQASLDAARDRLRLVTGRPLDAPLETAGDDLPDLAPPVDPAAPDADEALVRLACATRADVQEARDRIADARRGAAIARWSLLPPLTLAVSYTRWGLGRGLPDPFARAASGLRVTLTTDYALDRANERAAVAAADLTVAAATRSAEEVERRVAADVRAAWRAWLQAGTAIAIQRKMLDVSDRQMRLARLRYERGLDGNLDVVDAETNLFHARTALVTAEIERALAALALRRAVGVLDPLDPLR